MTNALRRTIHTIRAGILRKRALRTIAGMRESGDETVRRLAAALDAAARGAADEAESAWIDRIEAMRANLDASAEPISMIDYGAGTQGPKGEAGEGRVVTRTVGDICRKASKSRFWSFLLLRLIREFRPTACLELGTCLGVSAAYEGAALSLNGRGRLVTLEGDGTLAAIARENFRSLGLDAVTAVTGRFQDTLEAVLAGLKPIDYAFIDGHHDEEATIRYFEAIAPVCADRAVLVFDDISWSAGMERAWRTIAADRRVGAAVDLRQVGVALLCERPGRPRVWNMPLLGD